MRRSGLRAVLTYVVLTIAVVVWGFPMVWVAISSFKPAADLTARGFSLSFVPTLEHYRFVFERQPFLLYVRNSVIVTGISTLTALLIGSLAAYSMSRFGTGGDGLSFWVLSTRMAPPAVMIIPFFLIFQAMGMFNTWWALIVTSLMLNLSYIVWMLRDFFDEVPREIDDAAKVDGASRLQTMFLVIFPLARPGIIATTILAATFAWNEFLFSVVLTLNQASKTLPGAANDFVTGYEVNWGALFASGVMIVIPIVVFTCIVQKHIVRGLTLGAVR
jgi:multiple sugar transport system permease protein